MTAPNEDKALLRRLATGMLLLLVLPVAAQTPVDEDGNPVGTYETNGAYEAKGQDGTISTDIADLEGPLTAGELQDLVGPVALYPDDLLAIVLPASTYPLEIVQAARFLELHEADNSIEPDEAWDDSVVALLNYPDVLKMMDEEIDWTWRLGEAVLDQQNEVIAAVESFRDRAYAAGNLKSDEYQDVNVDDEGILEIVPVNEELIYVPYYEPAEVVVYQPRPVYNYYPNPYPVYYYPYPTGYHFRSGYFWGVTTAFSIGWSNHYLHVYHPSYWGHPYYGQYYYGHYYRRPSISIYNNWYVRDSYRTPRYRYRDGDYWRSRSRSDTPRVRNEHYSPNGSRNSRDFTVSRRDRLQVGTDGRLDVRLRDRGNNTSRTDSVNRVNPGTRNNVNRNNVNRNNGSRNSGGSRVENNARTNRPDTDRTRTATRDAADTNRRAATNSTRTNTARAQTTRPGTDIRFRDRSTDSGAANSASSRRTAGNARTNHVDASSARGANSRRNTATRVTAQPRSVTPTSNRSTTTPSRATAPASNRRSSAPPRATAPASNRRSSAPPRATAPTSNRRSSAPPRATAPQRRSAPAQRSTAPAVQPRAPSSNRSTGRSSSGATNSRRTSAPRTRVRTNNQD